MFKAPRGIGAYPLNVPKGMGSSISSNFQHLSPALRQSQRMTFASLNDTKPKKMST